MKFSDIPGDIGEMIKRHGRSVVHAREEEARYLAAFEARKSRIRFMRDKAGSDIKRSLSFVANNEEIAAELSERIKTILELGATDEQIAEAVSEDGSELNI